MTGNDKRWRSRDYPVLEWVVAQFDRPVAVRLTHEQVAAGVGITSEDASSAMKNLQRGGFIAVQWMWGGSGGRGGMITEISERALRETGVWPNDEAIADQLLWILERKIEDAPTPDERSRWVKIRDGFAGAGRDIAVEFAAAIAARSMGG